jgi:hypothetical protein
MSIVAILTTIKTRGCFILRELIRRRVVDPSPPWPGFDPGHVCLGFVVFQVVLGRSILR